MEHIYLVFETGSSKRFNPSNFSSVRISSQLYCVLPRSY